MTNEKTRMADKLARARNLIEQADRPEPMVRLSAFGYPETRLGEGRRYHQAAEQAYWAAQKQEAAVDETRETLEQTRALALVRYRRHVQLARVALLGQPEARSALGLRGRRKYDRVGLLRQASDFYHHALEDSALRGQLEGTGIDLVAGQALIDEVLRLQAERRHLQSQAQQARERRAAAFELLDGWLKRFVAVARVALEEMPALRNQLGI